jgi:hypothetical protein
MSERDVAIWTGVLEDVLFCVPREIRLTVLRKLAEDHEKREAERERCGLKLLTVRDLCSIEEPKYANAQDEATSLVVQVLVRAITNNHSGEDAAKILFREHRRGTGSGWLPGYLDGLPGLNVNLKHCAKIARSNGKSKLAAA